LETVPYQVGKLMTSELLGLGLLDKADAKQKEKPAYKNISCTEHRTMGLDTHDYGILTEPMQANMVSP
jgi:Xaa-Pro aminopeptidase